MEDLEFTDSFLDSFMNSNTVFYDEINEINDESSDLNHSQTILDKCPSCNADLFGLLELEGRSFCKDCGMDLGQIIKCNDDGRFDEIGKNSKDRTGQPINSLLPSTSMSTKIGYKGCSSSVMNRLRRFHNWSVMPSSERSLNGVYSYIAQLCSVDKNKLHPCIQKEAKRIFMDVSEY